MLPFGDYIDLSRYTAEHVINLARDYSPDCQAIRCGWQEVSSLVLEAEPSFTVAYIGKGKWSVVKVCSLNPTWDGAWYFDEHTNKFIWNFDNYNKKVQPSQ